MKKFIKKHIYIIIAALLFLTAGVIYVADTSLKTEEDGSNIMNTISESKEESTQTANKEKVVVYVCGNVNFPGIIECDIDSRLYEVINMAGGFSEGADIDALNLADTVKDKDKIYVPLKGEASVSDTWDNKGLININKADKEKLTSLPGIGQSRAEDIVKYRTENGTFSAIEDIMNVPGIKESAFNKIKDLISV
ncbi:MAG: helix-hairpin-helix domain-containing protein [Lachnospira sp.]|nr:helix-hairpin-helix domain-containing protein [Lachnospira sp.]